MIHVHVIYTNCIVATVQTYVHYHYLYSHSQIESSDIKQLVIKLLIVCSYNRFSSNVFQLHFPGMYRVLKTMYCTYIYICVDIQPFCFHLLSFCNSYGLSSPSPSPLPQALPLHMRPSRKNGHIPTAWQLEHGNLSDAEVGIPMPESEILRKLLISNHQLTSQTCFLCQGLFSNCIRCIEVQTIFFPATISQDLRVPDHSCHAARGEEPRCSREAPNKAHVRVQL